MQRREKENTRVQERVMGKFPADSTTAPTRENTPTVQNEISQLIHLGCADLPTSDVKTNQNTVVGLLVAYWCICFDLFPSVKSPLLLQKSQTSRPATEPTALNHEK
jgi:hypothetical protein